MLSRYCTFVAAWKVQHCYTSTNQKAWAARSSFVADKKSDLIYISALTYLESGSKGTKS